MEAEVPKNQAEILKFVETCQYGSFSGESVVAGKGKKVLIPPVVWSLDQGGRYRTWQVYVALATSTEVKEDPSQLSLISITTSLLNRGELPEGASGVYWTCSGVEDTPNPIISAPTYVNAKGFRAGTRASNYTTSFTQAIFDAMSLHKEKIKDGGQLDKSQLLGKKTIGLAQLIARPRSDPEIPQWRVFGMAVHDFKKYGKRIEYPCYVDPKYDGTMCIIVSHPQLPLRPAIITVDGKPKKVGMRVDIYSRGRKDIDSQDHILAELYPILKQYPGIHLVGELWAKGMSLQDISGATRRTAASSRGEAQKLNYNVFDCFRIDDPLRGYDARRMLLDDIFENLDGCQYVVRVPSVLCHNQNEVDALYKGYLAEGLEGAVVRNADGLYEFGLDSEPRTYDTLKLKPRPDEEYPVVGFEDGNGKESGLVKWICAENDKGVMARMGKLLPISERLVFKATPNQPANLRRHIYSKIKEGDYFQKQVYGKLVTVTMLGLSKGKYLPIQPKVIRFYDKAMDLKLQEGYTG